MQVISGIVSGPEHPPVIDGPSASVELSARFAGQPEDAFADEIPLHL